MTKAHCSVGKGGRTSYGRLVAVLSVGIAGAGCGVAPDGLDDPVTGIESTEGAITGGSVQSAVYSGIVALELYDLNQHVFTVFCSGTMMSNGVALTAKHCLSDPKTVGQQIWVSMGGQRQLSTTQSWHPSLDVAVIRFPAMKMWNWVFNHYATSPPQLNTTSFRRSIYQGTNASLNNTPLTCYGYGPGGPYAPMTVATFNTTFNDGLNPPNTLHLRYAQNGPEAVGGDSGMGCFLGNDSYLVPLAGIEQGTFVHTLAWADGAESWRSWFGY
jgi:hypothetical protein